MEPKKNCNLCSRLVDFRKKNKLLFPNFYNNRVLGTGPLSSELYNYRFGTWVTWSK